MQRQARDKTELKVGYEFRGIEIVSEEATEENPLSI